MKSVGILGIGTFLPSEIRTNDWWPRSIVEKWEEKLRSVEGSGKPDLSRFSEGQRLVLAAMDEVRNDPFKGSVERRIIAKDEDASEMEIRAAREAIERSGIDPREIDVLLTYSVVPDFLCSPNACKVHERLELSPGCFSSTIETGCGSFLTQLMLGEQMIRAGEARKVLLVQSSAITRLLPAEEPHSAWFGDAATAVVLGEVREGYGILGRAHRTEGRFHRGLLAGIPGKRWYDEGRNEVYVEDKRLAWEMIVSVAENGKTVIDEALHKAGIAPSDVDFFASHQATVWFRKVCKAYLGLTKAKGVDTFAYTGSLSASNIPMVLATAEREHILREGDSVAMYAGGTGVTYSGFAMRWGR